MAIDPIEIAKQKVEQVVDDRPEKDDELAPDVVKSVREARTTHREISKRLEEKKVAVTNRIARLEDAQAIVGQAREKLEKRKTLIRELHELSKEITIQPAAAQKEFHLHDMLPSWLPIPESFTKVIDAPINWLNSTFNGTTGFLAGMAVPSTLRKIFSPVRTAANATVNAGKWLLAILAGAAVGGVALMGIGFAFPEFGDKLKALASKLFEKAKEGIKPTPASPAAPAAAPAGAEAPPPGSVDMLKQPVQIDGHTVTATKSPAGLEVDGRKWKLQGQGAESFAVFEVNKALQTPSHDFELTITGSLRGLFPETASHTLSADKAKDLARKLADPSTPGTFPLDKINGHDLVLVRT